MKQHVKNNHYLFRRLYIIQINRKIAF